MTGGRREVDALGEQAAVLEERTHHLDEGTAALGGARTGAAMTAVYRALF